MRSTQNNIMNNLLPIFINLNNAQCLVVGGGAVAEQKIKQLQSAQAHITVISPEVTNTIRDLQTDKALTLHKRKYLTGDCSGYTIVFGTTDNPTVNEVVFRDAQENNIPVNIADVPELCSFYLGSVYREGDLCVAVSTNGKSPTLGKIIRDRVKKQFGSDYSDLLNRLGDIRPVVFSSTEDYEKRKAMFEEIVAKELQCLEAAEKNSELEQDSISSARVSRKPESHAETGRVLLVGAGPGDPDLITVKGLKALHEADVILYDYLVDGRLLAKARDAAERIFVGKKYGKYRRNQDDINALLITRAQEGNTVVRLKGGDPFVFGRGGEEAEALFEAGIEFEIIPGITAAVAATAYAGIPLTDRRYSSSFAFIAGHQSTSGERRAVNWKALAIGIDTVAVYMALSNLEEIIYSFINNGCPPETPVAIIQNGTLPNQKTVTGTLETIADILKSEPMESPALLIVGEVVRLRDHLQWFEAHSKKLSNSSQSYESPGVA